MYSYRIVRERGLYCVERRDSWWWSSWASITVDGWYLHRDSAELKRKLAKQLQVEGSDGTGTEYLGTFNGTENC